MPADSLAGAVEVLIAETYVKNMFPLLVTGLKELLMYAIHARTIKKQTVIRNVTFTVPSMLMLQFADADLRAVRDSEYQMHSWMKWMN